MNLGMVDGRLQIQKPPEVIGVAVSTLPVGRMLRSTRAESTECRVIDTTSLSRVVRKDGARIRKLTTKIPSRRAAVRVKVYSFVGFFPILFRECGDKSSPSLEGSLPGTIIKYRCTRRSSSAFSRRVFTSISCGKHRKYCLKAPR